MLLKKVLTIRAIATSISRDHRLRTPFWAIFYRCVHRQDEIGSRLCGRPIMTKTAIAATAFLFATVVTADIGRILLLL
jgi:hypothetical protein